MARYVQRPCWQPADLEGVVIREQLIELTTVATEPFAFIENGAEGLLYRSDM